MKKQIAYTVISCILMLVTGIWAIIDTWHETPGSVEWVMAGIAAVSFVIANRSCKKLIELTASARSRRKTYN